MAYLLAIDTTSGTSVALTKDGMLVGQSRDFSGLKHAESVGIAIAEIFEQTGLKPSVVGAVAVGRGPGLFTGLRVGIAAGIMFAEAVGAKLVGVVSHDAIAHNLYNSELAGNSSPLLIHTDARRGEVYWALYGGIDANHLPITLAGPSVGKYDDVVAALTAEFGELIDRTGGATAEDIAGLAGLQLAADSESDDTSALYLRAPDAALPKPNQGFGKRVSG